MPKALLTVLSVLRAGNVQRVSGSPCLHVRVRQMPVSTPSVLRLSPCKAVMVA